MTPIRLALLLAAAFVGVAHAQDPAQVAASQKMATAQYPDLSVAGTPLNSKFVAVCQQLKAIGSPQLRSDHWPEELALQCAKDLGIVARVVADAPAPVAAAAPPSAKGGPAVGSSSKLEESAQRVGSRQVVGRVLSVDLKGGTILVKPTQEREGLAVVVDYPDIKSVAQEDRVDLTAKECGVYHYTAVSGSANSVRAYRYGRGQIWQDRR